MVTHFRIHFAINLNSLSILFHIMALSFVYHLSEMGERLSEIYYKITSGGIHPFLRDPSTYLSHKKWKIEFSSIYFFYSDGFLCLLHFVCGLRDLEIFGGFGDDLSIDFV